MTGYTVHTGATEKFTKGWDQIFSGKPSPKPAATKGVRSTAEKPVSARKKAIAKKAAARKVKRGKKA